MDKAFHSGSGTDEWPPFAGSILSMDRLEGPIGEETSASPSLPNGVPVGKVPPPQAACYLKENSCLNFFYCSYADFSIFPPAESVFGFFLATSH